ncbi:MAG: DNA-processing protein DprA [Pseudomonadales bacterium]|nr:DNA-processing protein DprA [Pseudomonadales bacterium]
MISETDLPYWLALWRVPNIGSRTFKAVLEHFASLPDAFAAPEKKLMSLGLKSEQVQLLRQFRGARECELDKGVSLDLAWLEQQNCHLVTWSDPHYPALLKEITAAPPLLFVRGDPGLLNWPQIAIVGSRHASRQGLQNGREFAKFFVQQGFAVTSGLALGIDGAAHAGAIDGAGPTIGVTAHGLDKIFPKRNRPLSEAMLEKGAWVSEFPIGVTPKPAYFPRRNRIISGLSLGVLVVEAAIKSGSLITARLAIQQHREVFAIPGSIHNPLAKGCHSLIRDGAKLVEAAEDVTQELLPLLGYQQRQLRLVLNEEPIKPQETLPSLQPLASPRYDKKSMEFQVLSVLDQDPMLVDEIVVRTGINVADVNATLVMLEIEGAISNQQGGYTLAIAT